MAFALKIFATTFRYRQSSYRASPVTSVVPTGREARKQGARNALGHEELDQPAIELVVRPFNVCIDVVRSQIDLRGCARIEYRHSALTHHANRTTRIFGRHERAPGDHVERGSQRPSHLAGDRHPARRSAYDDRILITKYIEHRREPSPGIVTVSELPLFQTAGDSSNDSNRSPLRCGNCDMGRDRAPWRSSQPYERPASAGISDA